MFDLILTSAISPKLCRNRAFRQNFHTRKLGEISVFYTVYLGDDSFLIFLFAQIWNCVKSVRIRSFSGPYFPAFGLNTEIYSVWTEYGEILRIQSECGKILTRKSPNTDTFHAVSVSIFVRKSGGQDNFKISFWWHQFKAPRYQQFLSE